MNLVIEGVNGSMLSFMPLKARTVSILTIVDTRIVSPDIVWAEYGI